MGNVDAVSARAKAGLDNIEGEGREGERDGGREGGREESLTSSPKNL